MGVKTVKVTKYITTDQVEFIGYKNKQAAEQHEKRLQIRLKDLNTEFKILGFINIPQVDEILNEYNAEKIAFQHPDSAHEDGNMQDDFDEDVTDLIRSILFKDAICPDDMENLGEAVETICDVIDSFGGIDVINNLYHTYKKIQKGN